MKYRCVATSVEGFVQQLAVAYITHGYWFYVAGTIPEGKDPAVIDSKLIDRYGIAISKWARCRRKKQGLANMQYLRHGRFFVLLATKGRHEFFERERATIRDVRRKSIKFAGYSIGCRKGRDGRWHAAVRIDACLYREIESNLVEYAGRLNMRTIRTALERIPAEQYAPVRRQLLLLHRQVNRRRAAAGLAPVPVELVRLRRAVAAPFGAARDTISATRPRLHG